MTPEIKPNMANTVAENDELIQKALGQLIVYRMEAWFVPEPSHLERFISDVMKGEI